MSFVLVPMVYALNTNDDFSCSALHVAYSQNIFFNFTASYSQNIFLMFIIDLTISQISFQQKLRNISLRSYCKRKSKLKYYFMSIISLSLQCIAQQTILSSTLICFTVTNILLHRCTQEKRCSKIILTCSFAMKLWNENMVLSQLNVNQLFAKTQLLS